jgi:hypothetical protein
MGVAGELFLAGTGLTADEDRHLPCCRSLDLTDNGSHRRIAGDKAGGRAPNLVLKMLRSGRQIFARVRRTSSLSAFKCGFQFLNVAIGDWQAPPSMQHHYSADAGGFVLDEIEARVRKQFFQFDRPVCTENLIRVDDVMESPKLAE